MNPSPSIGDMKQFCCDNARIPHLPAHLLTELALDLPQSPANVRKPAYKGVLKLVQVEVAELLGSCKQTYVNVLVALMLLLYFCSSQYTILSTFQARRLKKSGPTMSPLWSYLGV